MVWVEGFILQRLVGLCEWHMVIGGGEIYICV